MSYENPQAWERALGTPLDRTAKVGRHGREYIHSRGGGQRNCASAGDVEHIKALGSYALQLESRTSYTRLGRRTHDKIKNSADNLPLTSAIQEDSSDESDSDLDEEKQRDEMVRNRTILVFLRNLSILRLLYMTH